MQRSSLATLVLMLIVLVGLGVVSRGLHAVAQQSVEDTDSAQTIEDDPTVAPDPDASADNNVTFPIDI